MGLGNNHLEQPIETANFCFSLGVANTLMLSFLSDQFLFFQTVFLFLQLERPMAVTDSYFISVFSPFARLFFTFPDDRLLFHSLVVALVNGISGCLQFLGTQLLFKDDSCASQGCFLFPGLIPRPAGIVSVFHQTSSSV